MIRNSTFLLSIDNITILTDPWFKKSLWGVITPAIPADKIEKCDVMLISHHHLDHFDQTAVKLAQKLNTLIIGSKTVEMKCKQHAIEKVTGLGRNEQFQYKNLTIIATFADHLFAKDAIGFIIKSEHSTIYFSGDTRFRKELIESINKFEIDIALIQIASTRWIITKDGMNIRDALKLMNELRPKIAIPMHYHVRFKQANVLSFKTQVENLGIKVLVLNPGENYQIN